MKTYQFQSSLNAGVLSPQLNARVDIGQYYKGLSQGDNILTQPQGGAIKRGGMELIDKITDDVNYSTPSTRLIAFGDYLLFFYQFDAGAGNSEIRVRVYLDDVLQTNINGSGNDYFDIAWTQAFAIDNQVNQFKYAISQDGIILVHEDFQPVLITTTSATTWTAANITFSDIPRFDFNDASSPTPTSAVWDLTLPGATSGDTIRASVDGIQSEAFPISSITGDTAANIKLGFQQVLNNFISGDITCVFKAGTTYTVTFANSAADDFESVNLVPDVTAAAPVSTAPNNTTIGIARKEPVWSATRGWPRTVCFHENRLVFGGSKSRTQTIWMSRTGEYFSFKNYRTLDNESISITLDVDQASPITNIFSERHLCVFTEKAEYYCPQVPVTPSNVAMPEQSRFGSPLYTNVTSIDNQVCFIQSALTSITVPQTTANDNRNRGGAVRNFIFDNNSKSYVSSSLSVMSDVLMKDPLEIKASTSQVSADSLYIYAIMQDGSLAVCNTLLSEGVLSWVRWVSGEGVNAFNQDFAWFKNVEILGEDVYFVMKRGESAAGSVLNTTIEKLNMRALTSSASVVYLDCFETATQASSTTVPVNTYLNNQFVTVIDNVTGDVYENLQVNSGAVTTPSAVTDYSVGLPFSPTLKTMPLNVSLQDGPHAGEPKRVVSVSSYLLDSQNVTVNGKDLIWPVDDSDPVSGRFDVRLSGWSVEAYVTISQTGPYPMNILDIGVEIDA